ncbi:amino acid/polyamine/organocation transporter (APC superfamily) [Amycolatopsis cihanbeyliensis]|uniref:Amino acid/polyamine/organocation transporter (APC superfamily) n=1 Tax=Amycolatopsis cihanbeyliensis TaxID=1128664 RepID=A0A542DRP0_AMYCI|nr:amino acid/polyamine/organocation transporter (APC superfamily) [Amycolatopsis cihanbeyliensis]
MIGLGSMIGAGVFAVFAPASAAAGTGLLLSLAIAGVVAYCNARSSAVLAAQYPVSGGTYVYGRERLGPWWGFTAGWGFVIGKTASCAAMALTVAAYVAPEFARPVAAAAVLALTVVNYFGITKTAGLARVLLAVALVSIGAVLVAVFGGGQVDAGSLGGGWTGGVTGVLQAAGLLFFAFAGYARIATMGEEVRDPGRTIPRAISVALAAALVLYAVVAVGLLLVLGPEALARSRAPLADAVRAGGMDWLAPAARIGAAVAGLGALLALITGIGRTTLAMARNHDLPGWMAGVHPRRQVPHHAESVLAVVVCVLVLTLDLRGAIGFSSFGVLVYYAIANASAFTLPAGLRRMPRWLPVLGLGGCLLLAATLPWQSVLAGVLVFAVGLGGRAVVRARRA